MFEEKSGSEERKLDTVFININEFDYIFPLTIVSMRC